MNDTSARLTKCFSEIFPDLTGEEISGASPRSVSKWDSIASINLLTIIEEEFGVSFGPDDLEDLNSFPAILDHLDKARRVS